MFGLLYVHQKRGEFSPSLYLTALTNFVTYTLCFLTAFPSDVMSQLFGRERGGASDSKNPDLYYCGYKHSIGMCSLLYLRVEDIKMSTIHLAFNIIACFEKCLT